MSATRQNIILCALLAALVMLAFSRTIDAEFLEWDDDHNVYQNPHLRELSAENLKWMFFDVGRDTRYKALAWLGWALIHEGFGLHAPAYHAANVIAHAINACLIFLLLLGFVRIAGFAEDRFSRLIAALGAALWAIHPLRVEAVAWVTGFPYQLSLMFLLLAFLSYFRINFETRPWKQRGYWLTLLFYFAAMLCYPMPIGGVAILIGLNVFPLQRIRLDCWRDLCHPSTLRTLTELMPLVLISVATLAVAVYGAHGRIGIHERPPTLDEYPVIPRMLQATFVWCYYLWKPFLPFGLSPVYSTFSPLDPTAIKFWLSVAAFAGISWLTWSRRTALPAWPAFWLAHLGVLLPVLGVNVLGHSQGDRYCIIHGLLLSMAFVWCALKWRNKEHESQTLAVTAVVTTLFAVLTWHQSAIWKNNTTFFTHQLETLPQRGGATAIALFRLGNVAFRDGEIATADQRYTEARAAHPPLPLPELPFRHGEVLYLQGRMQQAAIQYSMATRLKPDAREPWYGLSQSLIALGELNAAEKVCRDALKLHPNAPEFLDDLAQIRKLIFNRNQ